MVDIELSSLVPAIIAGDGSMGLARERSVGSRMTAPLCSEAQVASIHLAGSKLRSGASDGAWPIADRQYSCTGWHEVAKLETAGSGPLPDHHCN